MVCRFDAGPFFGRGLAGVVFFGAGVWRNASLGLDFAGFFGGCFVGVVDEGLGRY